MNIYLDGHFYVVGGDIGRVKDKKTTGSGDSYKVLLIDDARHTEKLGKYTFYIPLTVKTINCRKCWKDERNGRTVT